MKRLLLVAFILVMAASLTFAGGDRMTKKGTHALYFQMNGFGSFGVRSYTAGMIQGSSLYGFGGQWFFQDDMALRLGAGFGRWNENETIAGSGETDETEMMFALTPALLWYCMGEGSVVGYWGGYVSYAYASSEDKFTPTSGTGTSTELSANAFGAGLILGAQWWAWNQVAFHGEYMAGFSTSSSKVESAGTSTDGPTVTSFGIDSWSVGLGFFWDR